MRIRGIDEVSIVVLILVAALGVCIGLYLAPHFCNQYRYINRDYACGGELVIEKTPYAAFEQTLRDDIKTVQNSGAVTDVSVCSGPHSLDTNLV